MKQLDLFDKRLTGRDVYAPSMLNASVATEDVPALETSLGRVYALMIDGGWHDADEICGAGGRSAVRRLWDLKKFGHAYQRERVPGARPLYRYRLIHSPTNGVDAES